MLLMQALPNPKTSIHTQKRPVYNGNQNSGVQSTMEIKTQEHLGAVKALFYIGEMCKDVVST